MRDAFLIKGKEINYMDTNWVITELYYVPNNPNLYVELFDGKSRMNVVLDSIKDLIIREYYEIKCLINYCKIYILVISKILKN